MTIAIKTRNFSLDHDKMEGTFDKRADGLGWAPGYERKFEGVGINKARYDKNYAKMKGACKKCSCFTNKAGTNGEHCALPVNKSCNF